MSKETVLCMYTQPRVYTAVLNLVLVDLNLDLLNLVDLNLATSTAVDLLFR